MERLEALCYVKVFHLLIGASEKRKKKLLHILPDGMAQSVNDALGREKAEQVFSKGLQHHCFNTIINLVRANDENVTQRFLEPLEKKAPSNNVTFTPDFLRYLLIKYHNLFKWKNYQSMFRNVNITSEADVNRLIFWQYYHSSFNYFMYGPDWDPYSTEIINAVF
jgi:hypothetical protein